MPNVLAAPPAFPLERYLAKLRHGGMRHSRWRREACRTSPILFALTYMPHHLRSADTGDVVSLSEFHVAIGMWAREWMRTDLAPAECRTGWISARGSGKSTWSLLILPLWALAYEHRSFILAFSHTGPMARRHLLSLRSELTRNERLREDFPELCTPRTSGRRTVMDTQDGYMAASGAAVVVAGLDQGTLGIKLENRRPDMIICHEVGTPMLLDGEWTPVEDHPSFTSARECEGYQVTVQGVPFDEVVTPEHRYWAKWEYPRRGKRAPARWVEARELNGQHYIGTPVDYIEEPVGNWIEKMKVDGAERDELGRVHGTVWEEKAVTPSRFQDSEFWWLVGYWWGNGTLGAKANSGPNYAVVSVTIPNKKPEVAERIKTYLKSKTHRVEGSGCVALRWTDAPLARWLRTWKQGGSAHKLPPSWVERMPLELQRELVAGYVAADGDETDPEQVRLTSVYLPGLLMFQRIQSRLGVAVSIRRGPGPRMEKFPNGHTSQAQQKYDARWAIIPSTRYAIRPLHIRDGFLWRKVRAVSHAGVRKFAPIETESHSYITAFGLSHNCDDGEPPESNYSDHQKEQRLKMLLDAVLPMSLNAVVSLVGTTTRMGSIMDDVRTAKPWAVEENFTARHFPALAVDEDTGAERSTWAHRWPLEYLQSIQHTRSFALNYQCTPMSANGTHWTPDDFTCDTKGTLARHLDAKVLAIDPAVTSGEKSDQTGLAVVGYAGNVRKCLVEKARGVRLAPAPLRELVHRTLTADPSIRTVVVEVTNGGDWITQTLKPLPRGVELVTTRPSANKLARITALFDHYQRGAIVHAKPLAALEAQMLAHPTDHDDIIDSVDIAIRYLFDRYSAAGR